MKPPGGLLSDMILPVRVLMALDDTRIGVEKIYT